MKTMKHIIGKSVLGAAFITAFFVTISCSQFSDAYDSDELIAQEALTLPPDSNELIDITARKGNAVTRPVRITLEGIDNADGPGGTFTGIMTHLGKITGVGGLGEIYDVQGNVFKFRTLPGEKDIIYAANGDEVWAATEDMIITFNSETTAVYTQLIIFIGGTGRFEGASGFLEIENGTLEIVGLKTNGDPLIRTSHVGNGEITY